MDKTPEDEETTDELLGYKPHNIADYASEEFDYAVEHPLADVLDSDGTEEDLSKQNTGAKGVNKALEEEEDMDEYTGEIGDRYGDGEGNQFTVRNKVNGGVTLQGQGGEKEIATRDIQFLKKLSEALNKHVVVYDGSSAYVEDENNIPEDVDVLEKFNNIDDAQAFADKYNDSAHAITEEQVKTARLVLKNRINEGMTKKEAVQILIKHNIK